MVLSSSIRAQVVVGQHRSEQRHAVQGVLDACAHEITRRYREGEADVSALLPSEN